MACGQSGAGIRHVAHDNGGIVIIEVIYLIGDNLEAGVRHVCLRAVAPIFILLGQVDFSPRKLLQGACSTIMIHVGVVSRIFLRSLGSKTELPDGVDQKIQVLHHSGINNGQPVLGIMRKLPTHRFPT